MLINTHFQLIYKPSTLHKGGFNAHLNTEKKKRCFISAAILVFISKIEITLMVSLSRLEALFS